MSAVTHLQPLPPQAGAAEARWPPEVQPGAAFLNRVCLQAYVRVLDMNEHRPFFLKTLYTVSQGLGWTSSASFNAHSVCELVLQVRVPEDTAPWKDILQVSARDADANSKLVYSIHGRQDQDSTKLFHLDPRSGVLVLREELDYETAALHTLILMVRLRPDHGEEEPVAASGSIGTFKQEPFPHKCCFLIRCSSGARPGGPGQEELCKGAGLRGGL